MKKIAIIGEFTPTFESHIRTNAAIGHSVDKHHLPVEGEWCSTEDISETMFEKYHGLWVAPGSPYKNMDKTLWAIQYAREHGVPTLGTCGGFQHMIIEIARNVLAFKDAQHAEYDPYASKLFISKLTCSLVGREMELSFVPTSKIAKIYGKGKTKERYYCNFGVNPEYVDLLKRTSLNVVGSDSEGEIRVIEWANHPFFIGTLFVPQTLSTAENPHPLITAFLQSVAESSR